MAISCDLVAECVGGIVDEVRQPGNQLFITRDSKSAYAEIRVTTMNWCSAAQRSG